MRSFSTELSLMRSAFWNPYPPVPDVATHKPTAQATTRKLKTEERLNPGRKLPPIKFGICSAARVSCKVHQTDTARTMEKIIAQWSCSHPNAKRTHGIK